jgi:hypothetical protein
MLARPVIGGEAVFAAAIRRHLVEIEIERQRPEIAVNVHAVVFEPELFMQTPGRSQPRSRIVDVAVEL